MKATKAIAGLLACSAAFAAAPAFAQSEPFLGQLMLTPYNFCPRGWASASGQILSIAQNTALFSLLGTNYGGNGQTTFALPDLRGRVPNSAGQGPGLSSYTLGQVGGTETTTLTTLQMPIHAHTVTNVHGRVRFVREAGNTSDPLRNNFAMASGNNFTTTLTTTNGFAADSVAITGSTDVAGGSQPFSTMNPYLTMQWCIALEGIYPSRN